MGFFSKRKAAFGKGDATIVKSKKGKDVTLLNPSQKSSKFAFELKNDVKITNDGADLKESSLTSTERAYRSGYLDARKDNAKAYKHSRKQSGRKKSTPAFRASLKKKS